MDRRTAIVCAVLACVSAIGLRGQNSPTAPGRAAAPGPHKLTVDDYFTIKDLEDPQISPEGKWVAYAVTTHDLKEDKDEERVWMVATGHGEAVPMTAERVSSSHPRWSPDGKYLAFLSERGEGKRQVWTLNRNGGEAQQVSSTIQDVDDFAWSPAGDKIALVLRDPSPEEIEAAKAKEKERDKEKEKKPKTQRPWVIDRLQFKQDEVGYLDRGRTHLYVLDVASRKMVQVTSGDYDDEQPAWSPDGRSLAFVSNRTPDPDRNYNTDIWVVAADNSDQGKTLRQITTNPGADHSPSWSPDGKWIAFVSRIDVKALDYATPHLGVAPSSGGEEKVLTLALDRWVAEPHFTADGNSIVFILEDDGTQNLASIPAAGGQVTRLIAGRRMVSAFSANKDGGVAALISDIQHPFEVYLLRGGDLRRLTTTNDAVMAQIQLGDVEYVHFQSKDGTPVAGYLYKPPDYQPGKRYPTILRPHGGPVWAFYAEFNFEPHLYAANGYAVLTPNPRGSSGYGQKFSQAIYADWGNKDFEDEMAAVDYAIAQGLADPERLGVGGWSYGGIMTNYCITKSNRFKAAISGASEALYISNYGHDHYQKDWELEIGLPWENRALYEKLSPFNSVQNITAATLIVGGEIDWNVPILNSEQLYQALKRLGRTTELIVYPGEYHEFTVPSHIKDRYERYLAWYGRYLKGEAPGESAKTATADSK
jgi:dipeptidyl aminopeptidase/acylaminoacyl peptidase